MRLIPERRTLDMAKSWWTAEMTVLKRCKERVDADRQALEEGGRVWDKVTQLVSTFEADLRQAMQGSTAASSSSSSPKGKDKVSSQEEILTDQLSRMRQVIEELEGQLKQAEEKRWNLLICAIGAELEAFKEAYNVLNSLLHPPEKRLSAGDGADAHNDNNKESEPEHREAMQKEESHGADEESDNEVPSDFLGGEQEVHDEHPIADNSSENEVPPEFLVEHV